MNRPDPKEHGAMSRRELRADLEQYDFVTPTGQPLATLGASYGLVVWIGRDAERGNAGLLPTLDHQFWQDSWAPSCFIYCSYLCGVMGLVFAQDIRLERCSNTFGLDDDHFHPKNEP